MIILQTSGGTDALTNFLFKAEVIDSGIDNVIAAVSVAATILAAIFYFSNLGFNYAVTALKSLKDKNAEFFVDYEELARTLVLVGCILIYPAIAHTLELGMDSINKLTNASNNQMKQYEQMVSYSNSQIAKENVKETNDSLLLVKACADNNLLPEQRNYACQQLAKLREQKASSSTAASSQQPQNQDDMSVWQSIKYYANPVNWVKIGIGAIVGLLTSIIRIIIACLTYNVLKVLFCIGPLAFAFSILPPFKNNVTTWFATVLNTGFVFTTMNILDAVFYETMFYSKNVVSKSSADGFSDYYAVLGMNTTYIILYLMVFWLTSKYVGKGDAGRVLSKAAGIATAAAGGAIVAAGGATASNVGNVAKSANDAISGQ